MIMSYHQSHYREDHTAPSRANGGRVFNRERRERARRAGYHRGGICGHRTFLSHARLPSTSLCGPDEDWGGAGGGGVWSGKEGGELFLQGQRLDFFQNRRPTLPEPKTVCSNPKGGISESRSPGGDGD